MLDTKNEILDVMNANKKNRYTSKCVSLSQRKFTFSTILGQHITTVLVQCYQ